MRAVGVILHTLASLHILDKYQNHVELLIFYNLKAVNSGRSSCLCMQSAYHSAEFSDIRA